MTHGSVQKAGKVRNQTPKVEQKHHISRSPRLRNKHNYYKRYVKGIPTGQQSSARRRRRR
ncbi:MAG: 30S ribosomal protein S30e [Asgard group archaeon]|nr:30S ribosomal protein S30e [Candidatus Heimdallarchaeota archaeon]MCK5158025.1 30S ribosomal protein S30e [Candidatus Heimdallarchaeota archaeon]MCK5185351.1 30S ribosomal protein S30e [Candidatus Heimdallarchaeota archaeon]NPE08446.1 30S ribosomal protein S30e [Asgard group archaeon]